ncbi:MAG: DUF819 family protein [Enterobacterales bacterium]|nr:DUF819 family protein [Enterobacterales bacterium]
MTPIIDANWTFAIWGIMLAIASFAIWMERTKLGATVSGVMVAIVVSILLSNFYVIPKSAPAYDVVWSYLLPMAVPLLLLKADIRQIIAETGGMLGAFFLGTLGTVVGVLIGVWLLPLGEAANQLAGIFSATYIGGSMNMAAVAGVLEVDPTLYSASVAADNVVGVLYLGVLAFMPAYQLLRRFIPSKIMQQAEQHDEQHHQGNCEVDEKTSFELLHICFALSLSLIICALGYFIAESLGIKSYAILFITAITVLIANLFAKPLQSLQGDYDLGMLFMYLFFVAIGASADVALMIDQALILALFTAIIIFFHMTIILLGGKLFKLDLAEIIIASNACAMGPATAVAMAASNRWKSLMAPSVMLGVFGYVIANFIGVSLASILA